MPSLTFIKPGLYTSIQDQGRQGLAYYAIPRSGGMDRHAADQANTLVGNELTVPLIEASLIGPSLLFHSAATIALAGAAMQWKINGELVSLNRGHRIQSGDTLSGGPAKEGLRGYIAIRGKIISEQSYGSCAAYSYAQLGHNKGQAIKRNQILEWTEPQGSPMEISLNEQSISTNIKIHPGPEYNLLTEEAKALLTTKTFVITPESNRMGAKLNGPNMELSSSLISSVAVLPGFIQLPVGGQPIVVLQDGQTTGGYPRIAFLPEEELSLFNRLAFNMPFRFYF